MQFIVHPGKLIGTKSPVQKHTWYNTPFIKQILHSKLQEHIHFYKNNTKPSGSFILSNSKNIASVEVIKDVNRNEIEVSFKHTYMNNLDHTLVQVCVLKQNVSENDLEGLDSISKLTLEHLIKSPLINHKKQITQSVLEPIWFYTIRSVIKKGQLYVIKTNNLNTFEISINKKEVNTKPMPFDIGIVNNNKHTLLNRVDFYKYFKPIF